VNQQGQPVNQQGQPVNQQGQPVNQQGPQIPVIAPISDELLQHIDHVLPSRWSEDETTLEIVQWVIYLFFNETDEKKEAAYRMKKAMEMAAARFDTDQKAVKRVCTTTLYREESDNPTAEFRNDIRMIYELHSS